jgi:carbonic anhydrase
MESQEIYPLFTKETPITALLSRNQTWASLQKQKTPTLFKDLANRQEPHILWIGCSDSRVPETTILSLLPGDVFVHRNIANVVSAGDLSVLSVVQYAVEILKVEHIIICGSPYNIVSDVGHYGCGGCIAAMGHKKLGLIDNWLRHIRDVRVNNAEQLDSIEKEEDRVRRLIELKLFFGDYADDSVVAQVNSMKRIPTVQEAMEGRGLEVHGWVFEVADGLIKSLDVPQDIGEKYYKVVPK